MGEQGEGRPGGGVRPPRPNLTLQVQRELLPQEQILGG
jgi:hypothetical protein